MIKQVTMYSCTCDGCGQLLEMGDGIIAMPDKEQVEEQVRESDDWQERNGGHYCDGCAVVSVGTRCTIIDPFKGDLVTGSVVQTDPIKIQWEDLMDPVEYSKGDKELEMVRFKYA